MTSPGVKGNITKRRAAPSFVSPLGGPDRAQPGPWGRHQMVTPPSTTMLWPVM